MIKYNIDVNDLTNLIDGLNNAILAYKEVIDEMYFGFAVSSKFKEFENIPIENLYKRLDSIKQLYDQLINFE